MTFVGIQKIIYPTQDFSSSPQDDRSLLAKKCLILDCNQGRGARQNVWKIIVFFKEIVLFFLQQFTASGERKTAHCAQAWVCVCKDIWVVCRQGTMTQAWDFSHLTPPWPLKVSFPVGCPDTIDCKKTNNLDVRNPVTRTL